MTCSVVGYTSQVVGWLRHFIELTQADEVVIEDRIYNPVARCRSYQLAAESLAD